MDWNELQSLTWPGYARKNGGKGIRNRVLVIYTVKCAEFVAQQIVAKSGSTNVELLGFDGCTDNQYAVNLLISFIRHPNVGAVLAVGLGCEYVQPEWLSKIAEEEGKPTSWMFIQNEGGTQPAVRKGVEWVQSALKELENTPLVEMSVKDLVIGAECGGSDYTSGLAGNVVVGRFYDWLTDQGGTAIFEEIVEAIGLDHLLLKRAASEQAAKELRYTYDKALEYCRSVRQYSVSPGNFAGGLSTIEEKSMGAVIKSGSRPIQGVIKVSCQFLPASIRPLAAQVPTAPYILPGEEEDKRLKVAGYACTVLENDVFEYPAEKPFGYMTEALDDLKPNEIYIATGAHNSALWGELLTACGKARGAVGAVLDGYTRDTPKVIEQNFPVFCSGTWAQDSSVRTYVFKWRCPIEIGQVTIHNGDIVFGDIDGVLIIPKDIAPEVIEKALVKASTEKTMRKAIEDGMMVTDAFAKFGVL